MFLATQSNAAYLNESRVRSCTGSYIFCLNNDPIPRNNDPAFYLVQMINVVMS